MDLYTLHSLVDVIPHSDPTAFLLASSAWRRTVIIMCENWTFDAIVQRSIFKYHVIVEVEIIVLFYSYISNADFCLIIIVTILMAIDDKPWRLWELIKMKNSIQSELYFYLF